MAWVTVNGHDIYYTEAGSGQPLVFLHGMTSCSEAWDQQFDAFKDRFRVIAYDSVNHGHSTNSPRDEDEPSRVDELEGFLAALGIERPILAGNSMGALTILCWAARHPGDALALVPSGMGVPEPGVAAAPRNPDPLPQETIFLPFGDALTPGLKERNPVLYDRYYRIRSTATRIEALRHPRRLSPTTREEWSRLNDTVAAVTSPMLIVVGSLDRLVPATERLHALVPHSEYRVIDGAPHNVYYEAAAEYNQIVGDFLDRVIAGRQPAAVS